MRKIYYLLLFLSLGLGACNKEDDLSPSLADEDRLSGQIDLSFPLVKHYKENYNVNILWNFDDILDFKFTMGDEGSKNQWEVFNISHMEGDSVIDANLVAFDSYVLQCFRDTIVLPEELGAETICSNFKKKYFPRKLLLADTITTDGNKNCPDQMLLEADVMKVTENTWYALWNGYEQLFACSEPQLRIKNGKMSTLQQNIRAKMIFSLLVNIIERHKLYNQIPEEFFTPCEHLYGKDITELAKTQNAIDTTITTTDTICRIPANWYIGLGMAMSNKSPVQGGTACSPLDCSKTLTFPTKERDVRNFLNVIICETKTTSSGNITRYYAKSDVFKERMKILVKTLYGLGIDVFAINPAIEKFYDEK